MAPAPSRRLALREERVLAVGGTAWGTIRLSKQIAGRIEEHTGTSAEQLTQGDLIAAAEDLGLQSIGLTADYQATITEQGDLA